MKLKNLFTSLACLLIFFFVFAGNSMAQTTYYVDGVAGNDNWTGTAQTFQSGNVGPKKTIQAMHDASGVVNGDVISIAAATYNETVTLTKRVQLSPSAAITVQNLTLNTASSTSTTVGNAAQNLTISGTLLVQSGRYALTTANVIIAAAGTMEVRVGGASAGITNNSPTTTAGAYTLTFANTSALTYQASNIGNNNPGNVNFNGSALVTLPGALTVQGNLTIASGASVNVNGFDITVQGGGFTNNGSYYDAAGFGVVMNTAGGTIAGTGTFQNLTLNQDAITWALGSSLTFNNVSQALASLISVTNGILTLGAFDITTPGSFTYAGAADGFNATTGKLIFSGTAGTIGTVNFTLGQALTVPNLRIDKPSGSIVAIPAAPFTLTVGTLFEFIGGIFNVNDNPLTLANAHGATASIGGNLNGTGIFTIGAGSSTNNITVSGAGQINTPFVVNATPRTVTFTQLTTIGNNLTLTSGNLTTSSLQLINGTVTLTAGTLTFNTATLSVTNTVTLNGGTLAGSSNITVSGAFAQNAASIVNTTGTLTVASYAGGGGPTGAFTSAGLSTTGGGNIVFTTGNVTINGNLNSTGAVTTSDGIVEITGSATSTGAFTVGTGAATGVFRVGAGITAGGAFSFASSAATALTVTTGNFAVTGTANLTNGASITVSTGNFTASGLLTTAACIVTVTAGNLQGAGITLGTAAVTVGGNVITTGANDLTGPTGAAGDLVCAGTVTASRDIISNVGDMTFNGTGAASARRIISVATDADVTNVWSLKITGPLTLSGSANQGIVPGAHGARYDFGSSVNMGSTNDVVLTGVGATFTLNFSGALTARDVLTDADFITNVNFLNSTSLPSSQIRDLSILVSGSANFVVVTVPSVSATNYAVLNISGDITVTDDDGGTLITVGANSKVVMNGSGDLQTYANAQLINLVGKALSIVNLEIANTGTDSAPTVDAAGSNAATPNETLESVYVTVNTLSVTRLTLTSNGLNGTNVTVIATGTITRAAGSINVATVTTPGQTNIVYTNQTDITTGFEYATPAAADRVNSVNLSGTGGKVTMTANSGTVAGAVANGAPATGALTVATGRELVMTDPAGPTNYTFQISNTVGGTIATVNGTVSGTNPLTINENAADVAYTVTGTGTVNNITFSTFDNALDVTTFSIANVLGAVVSTGANGTMAFTTSGPSTIGGALTLNNAIVTFAKALTVTGNTSVTVGTSATVASAGAFTTAGTFTKAGAGTWTSGTLTLSGTNRDFTHTLGNISIGGNLVVSRDYTQAGGNLTITSSAGTVSIGRNFTWAANTFTPSVSGNVTITGNLVTTGGTIAFPAASTSNLIVIGTTNQLAGSTWTFGAGSSGRVIFNGTAAQTLNLTVTNAIARFALNNAAGLTVSGAAVQLQIVNLLLTNGVLTHNGLLNMAGGTDRIIRDAGSLASFPATGPGEVEYISTAGFTTGFETPSILNRVIVNATSGNPTYTLDKNITILTGGVLNLSRGTLVVGGNSLIVQNTCTIMRAEGALTGTPTYGTGQTLQYFNTASDLITGTEFTNDGSITTLVINSPARNVILGGNVTVAGASGLNFGTLNLNNFTFTQSGNTFTNDGAITGPGTLACTGGATLAGTTAAWPAVTSSAGATVITPTAPPARAVTFASLTISAGSVALTAANITNVTVTGAFTLSGTATYTDNGDPTNFQGNVTVASTATLAQTGLFSFTGTSTQTLSIGVAIPGAATVNNAAGVTLGANLLIADAGTLTMTAGNITTGTNRLQLGTTAAPTFTRTAGMVVGNLYRWVDSDPATGVTVSSLFPLGTGTDYRPVTLAFTGTAAGTQGQIIRTSHTNSAPTGTVGLPITGPPVINKLSPMYWDVAIYDQANTAFQTPLTNPQVTLGVGGFTYGDITRIRSVYRLTNAANTWQIPGVYVGAYYDVNGVANVIHSGVSGWNLEPSQLFTVGYASTLAVANAIAAQTLTVGGASYTKTIQASPAVFSGNIGALTYTVSSSVPAAATASVAAGVLTVNPVSAGTSVITLTATDVNGDAISTTFNVTVNVAPTFSSPVVTSYPMNEGTTQNVTFAASATGQTVALSMLAGNPAYATFTAGTGVLALAPGYDVVTTGSKTDSVTIRATASPSGLTTDLEIFVTVTNVNRAPVFTAQMTNKSIKNDSTLTFTYTATDADLQTLTFALVPVTPAFAGTATVGASTGLLTFAPTFADAGKVFSVGVTVSDGIATVASTVAQVTVTYARSKGDVDGNGIVQAVDASKILQHVVGLITITGAANLYAADVNSDSRVGALDAAWVLYYVVYGSFPTGKIGAVNGKVSWGDVTNKSDIVTIPLKLSEGTNVLSANISINIDKNLASLESISSNLPEGWQIAHHVTDAGKINIALAGIKPLEDGSFVDLTLKLLNKEARLSLEGNVDLNDQLSSMLKSLSVRQVPTQFGLSQNYPNPFNPTTKIQYQLPQNSKVSLVIYDMLGQKVKTLVNSENEAGYYTIEWNGIGDNGTYVTSGLYIYRLEAGSYVATKKMNFVK